MQPSSLVFVAIIAVWAAILLPLWVSSREALGHSRGADRDSEHMRMLAWRETRPASTGTPSSAPLLNASPRGRGDAPVITAGRGPGLSEPHAASGFTRAVRAAASPRVSAAGRRARVLATLTVFALTSWAVAALPQVPAWVAVPATGLLLVDVLVLVATGRRRVSRRRVQARRVAMGVVAAQQRTAVRRPRAAGAVPRQERSTVAASSGSSVPSARSVHDETDASTDRLDLDAIAAAAAAAAATTGPGGDTWTPVPVPRPTYMLKPVVHRADPPPLVDPADAESLITSATTPQAVERPAPVAETPEPRVAAASGELRPWEVEHTWADDLDVFLARRRAANG